ncbi:hypothetical protein OSTOST_15227, partial [Ostertagia ostertagi]
MHKMLLRSLIWQTAIPSLFILVPFVLLILSGTSENVFVEGAGIPYYAELFPAIAICIFSLYSIADVIIMMTLTEPYRQFIIGLICRRSEEAVTFFIKRT